MANQAQIKKALQRPYDLNLFAKEVLSPIFGSNFKMSNSPVAASISPTQTENQTISKVLIYGKIDLEDGTDIICYEILLQPYVRIEQSKIAIQRYARKLLIAGQAALINFVSPTNKNLWRLTYIAVDTQNTEQGIKEKSTNAKRYTYLLGTFESCKTAAERFELLSAETSLTMGTMIRAFSVEKLSKSFFDEYLLHYNRFVDYLTKSNFKTSVFNADEKGIRDFTKKMLGRIVFLYFVQKKGWLGASTTDYKDGLHNFIPQFFELSGANDAFYDAYLKILFFETLNKQRANDDFTMPDGKILKIPYLNGGLFDKEDFDEKILTFKADLFHNVWDEDNPKTRGFLDFLNAYNFTVYEDCPDEHTIAVDPEMLGHIFENLLEDNKDKGAYYTPKEIVHYMCQESLTEYLKTNLTKNLEGLEHLVKQKETENLLKPELKEIDNLLNIVKICDPAIGSGAFPMGLLQEIFAIKEVIAYETATEWKPAQVKENIIQNSIYGVDIEKGAVDIARLRFWLSLVVDEEKPKALPNLDYKILVGNSLVSKFEDEIIEIDWSTDTTKAGMYGQENKIKNIELLTTITAKHKSYFHSENIDKKNLFNEIRNLKIDILINQLELMVKTKGLEKQPTISGKKLKEQTELYLQTIGWKNNINKLKNLKKNHETQFNHFDWQLDFPEVLNPYLFETKSSSKITVTNAQIVALNKQIDAINKHLEQQNISEHLIHLQVNIAHSQITLVKEQLLEIEKIISTIYGELYQVENYVVKEPYLSFAYKIKGINKGIDEINKRIAKINPQINVEKTSGEIGFDIVIGNPPYIQLQKFAGTIYQIELQNKNFSTFDKRGDIYCLFFEKGHNLLKSNGILVFITSNKWLRAGYGELLRDFFITKTNPIILIDFGGYKVFESASVDTSILLFRNNKFQMNLQFVEIKDDFRNNITEYFYNNKTTFITVHFLILESMLFLLTSDSVVHLYKYFE